jgi:hypothetical protein
MWVRQPGQGATEPGVGMGGGCKSQRQILLQIRDKTKKYKKNQDLPPETM